MVQGGLKKVQGGLSPPWHPTSRAYDHRTKLLEFVATMSYEVDSSCWLPKTAIYYILYRIIL